MCKFNPKNDGRRIDPCMKKLIKWLNNHGGSKTETIASCCGHGKYPMTIVVKGGGILIKTPAFEILSQKSIPRKRRFYVKDKQDIYYIPETLK